MDMKKFLKHIALYMAMLLLLAIPMPVLAAGSAGISLSSSSVTVGNTVKVTFSFNGGGTYLAGVKAYISYDASLLKYSGASGDGDANVASGSGTVVLETSSTSKSALSITMTFQTTAAGSAKVSVTGSDMVDWDGNTIGNPTASKTITIKEKEATKPVDNTDKEPEKETEKETQKPEESQISEAIQPTDLETAIEVQVNGNTLYLWKSLQNVNLPEGFTVKTIVYNGEQVQAANREDLDMTLLYFTNGEGANGRFFVYNGYDAFYAYQVLNVGMNTYIPMLPGEEVVFPQGYEKGELLIQNEAVFAWIHEEDGEYAYLYLMNPSVGKAGIYLYDRQENTLQRVNQQMYTLLLEAENPQEDVPVIVQPEPEQPKKGVIDRILEDDGIMMVVVGIMGVSLLLIAVMGSILIASKKKRNAQAQAETTEILEEASEEAIAADENAEMQPAEEHNTDTAQDDSEQ